MVTELSPISTPMAIDMLNSGLTPMTLVGVKGREEEDTQLMFDH